MSDDAYEEKRNFIRMLIDTNVTITDPETKESFQGNSHNLSGDGVMFITDKAFDINKKLKVNINSESGELPPLTAVFEVKRVKEISGEKFEVGGMITDVK
ncbi:MAG: PilZ domain-containing protein [Gammaproteobacteria bacterium]|nr:PilZ domain-containing protein [Gammaproteobacteria bacterium]MDH5629919.1 PilZ domain-containing protein [Gammaproteobacteria bacterium]